MQRALLDKISPPYAAHMAGCVLACDSVDYSTQFRPKHGLFIPGGSDSRILFREET